MAITTGIVGAAGFAGIELIRLALRHPDLDLRVVTSNELAGTPVVAEYPGFTGATDLAFTTHDDPALDACDLVFLAVPHTAALAMAPRLVARGATVVDLSADFRLKDPAVYERWYATPHTATDLLQRAAFGLPELFPDDLARAAGARAAGEGVLVACAGCYPTATSLAAAPAVRAGLVRPDGVVVVDAISGVTGAGKKATARTHFCFADENLEAYGVATHRHTPEIEEQLGYASGQQVTLNFTPHLVPMNRGILSTEYAKLTKEVTPEEVKAVYDKYYAGEKFVRVLGDGVCPETKWVEGSNYVDIGFQIDKRTGRIIMMGAMDNLVKGAAGQAVQNMNLMFGLPESEGLQLVPMFP